MWGFIYKGERRLGEDETGTRVLRFSETGRQSRGCSSVCHAFIYYYIYRVWRVGGKVSCVMTKCACRALCVQGDHVGCVWLPQG